MSQPRFGNAGEEELTPPRYGNTGDETLRHNPGMVTLERKDYVTTLVW